MNKMMLTVIATMATGMLVANEVKNSEFEEGAKYWHLNDCFSVARGYGENGSGGLKYENYDPSKYLLPRQPVKLMAEREYRLACRMMVEKLESKGGHGGARICIEFADKNGKWCGGSYWGGSGKRTTDGKWITLEKIFRVPANAVSANVSPYVDKGMVGVCYFDAIAVELVEVKPVSGLFVSAYRATASEGGMELIAALELAAAGVKREEVCGEFSFKDKTDKLRVIKVENMTADEARVKVRVDDFPIGESLIEFCLLKDGKEVSDSKLSTKFTRTEKPIERKVYIDQYRRMIKDGKPFFPMGVYLSEKKVSEEILESFNESGVNVVMNYHAMKPEIMAKFLDKGIYTFYVMLNTMPGRGFPTQESSDKWVKKTVASLKDNPALLGWYVNDELNVEWLDKLRYRQRMYEELDPDHPTWSVIYQLADMRKHMGTCDIMGSDPYPISNNDDISMPANWTKQTIDKQFGIRGCIQVPQGFDWGDYWPKKRDKTRMPTKDEMVNMGLQSIAVGANGLVYYSYSSIRRMTNDTFKTQFDVAWKDLKATMREIRQNERVYLLEPGPQVTTNNEKVFARTWKDGAKIWVLVVNAAYKENAVEVFVQGVGKKTLTLKSLGYKLEEW